MQGPTQAGPWLGPRQLYLRELVFSHPELFATTTAFAYNPTMSGPSDKARFFLEQSAEELNKLEQKQVFSRVGSLGTAVETMLTYPRKK